MVFDGNFSTVPSIASNTDHPTFWNTVDLEENALQIPLDENYIAQLDLDWLNLLESED